MVDAGILAGVRQAVLDQGELTKDQVMAAWPMGEWEYTELQRELVRCPGIEAGPPGKGGFRASVQRGALPDESESDEIVLRTEWEQRCVDLLVELLQHRQLEDLLGNLVHTIRQVRKRAMGEDRRGTKRELASALVIQHGQDLFRNKKVREEVSRALKIACPKKWHPGKQSAAEFVEASGFPPELAGLPTPDALPHFELLGGAPTLRPLLAFQREVQIKLMSCLYEPGGRAIVTLPTGAGKTRVAVESIRYWLSDRFDPSERTADRAIVLWLAHTEELCEQAYQCFRQVWETTVDICPLLLVRFWGPYTRDPALINETLRQATLLPSILISTPQRIASIMRDKIEGAETMLRQLKRHTGLVVVDEAHRAAAKMYRSIIEDFGNGADDLSIVGLTATPFRMEYDELDPQRGTKELKELFGRLIEADESLGLKPRETLQEMEVLARPQFETIETPTVIRWPGGSTSDELTDESAQYIDSILATRTDNTRRRLKVLEKMMEMVEQEGSSVLYFGPSVRDAECMTYLLRSRGVQCAVVTGNTRDVVRREAIKDFKQKKLKVLCNCEVLTTGFDAPEVSHIMMARPTVSQVLYEQVVGRGLRGPKFGGTASCTIIDCEDQIRGNRPMLGYEEFRKVWGNGSARVHKANGETGVRE